MSEERVVVIGAGHAGVQVADSLRELGHPGEIHLIGAEEGAPYQRPPLSKDFVGPNGVAEALPLRGGDFFEARAITRHQGRRVRAVDPARREVGIDGSQPLSYDWLVLATGARPRRLEVEGCGLAGVHVLRTLADAAALRTSLGAARSLVVAGAGFIGLELAAGARGRGIGVTVLEAADRALARATSAVVVDELLAGHDALGARVVLGEPVARICGHRRVEAVVGGSGEVYPADVVVLGVGVSPRDELARDAGLAVDDGVLVDASLATADPQVYAVGDCARFPWSGTTGTTTRVESVQNAVDQARHVARLITGHEPRSSPYRALPWFWSVQGPMRLQIAGLAEPEDRAEPIGEAVAGRLSVARVRGERVVAIESLNQPAVHLGARRLLTAASIESRAVTLAEARAVLTPSHPSTQETQETP